MMTDNPTYTHHTIPCAVLDEAARLPTAETLAGVRDPLDVLLLNARKAQIHLEMRLEMLAEEEEQEQRR